MKPADSRAFVPRGVTAALLAAAAGEPPWSHAAPFPCVLGVVAGLPRLDATAPYESLSLLTARVPHVQVQLVLLLMLLVGLLLLSRPPTGVTAMASRVSPAAQVGRTCGRSDYPPQGSTDRLSTGRSRLPLYLHVPRRRCLCRVRRASKRRRSALPIHPCCTTNSAARTRAQTANPAAPPVDLPAQPPDERPAR